MLGVGERIRTLREKREMSQIDLAKFLNVSKATMSKYESGTVQPSLESLNAICGLFNVSLDYLAGINTPPPKSKYAELTPTQQKAFDRIKQLNGADLDFALAQLDLLLERRVNQEKQ